MTQQEIIDNNRLIAEFMGLDVLYENRVHHDSASKGKVTIMKYHSSWDWLMPVVEKIESTDLFEDFRIEPFQVVVRAYESTDNKLYKIIECKPKTKLEAIYKAVIEFIKWYNQQEKN